VGGGRQRSGLPRHGRRNLPFCSASRSPNGAMPTRAIRPAARRAEEPGALSPSWRLKTRAAPPWSNRTSIRSNGCPELQRSAGLWAGRGTGPLLERPQTHPGRWSGSPRPPQGAPFSPGGRAAWLRATPGATAVHGGGSGRPSATSQGALLWAARASPGGSASDRPDPIDVCCGVSTSLERTASPARVHVDSPVLQVH